METEATYELDQVRVLLEWQEEVLMCFQEDKVRLAERVVAKVFPLKVGGEQTERQPLTRTQEKGPVPVGADYQGASAPPLSFCMDISPLVDSLVKNGSGKANQSYRRLRFFSGQLPTPVGEDEFETWMSPALQAMEE